MKWFKRISLFLLTNFLILITLSLVLNLIGVQPYLTSRGMNYQSLAIFCLVWGMGGAFISLAISRLMAKWMMGVKVIDPSRATGAERELVHTVHQLARGAGLRVMPEVGIYESPEVNAFATGPTQSRSLVAVSTGLLYNMNRDEVEGVLAHEVAHIANGDMVTMTLVQGVVNAFVMFFARIIAYAVAQVVRGDRDEPSYGVQMIVTFVMEMVLGIFGVMLVNYFSRMREFRADAGGARLAGRDRMVAALERLRRNHELVDTAAAPALNAFKISGKEGWMALFSTHPPLEQRIERLRGMSVR